MAYFRTKGNNLEHYFNYHKKFHLFPNLSFIYIEDTCDGFCPDCKEMPRCEFYKELKDEWEGFYL